MGDRDQNIPHDDMFTVSYSDSMEIRNILRTKLVQAQGRETDKVPLFVSWPGWLEDGIVCLYVRDLQEILRDTVRETAHAMLGALDHPADQTAGTPASESPESESPESRRTRAPEPVAFAPLAPASVPEAGNAGSPDTAPPAAGKTPPRPATASAPGATAASPQKPPKTAVSPPPKPKTLGSMLDQDDIEQLIREEMNRKKR